MKMGHHTAWLGMSGLLKKEVERGNLGVFCASGALLVVPSYCSKGPW